MRRQISRRYIPNRYLTTRRAAVISVNPEVNRLFVRTEDKNMLDKALEEQKDKLKVFEQPTVEVKEENVLEPAVTASEKYFSNSTPKAEEPKVVEDVPVEETVDTEDKIEVSEEPVEVVEEVVEQQPEEAAVEAPVEEPVAVATEDKTPESEVKESAYAKRKKAKLENKK